MDELKVTLEEIPTIEASLSGAMVNYSLGDVIRHSDVTERSFPDQHPISAITGLEEALSAIISQETLNLAVEKAVRIILENAVRAAAIFSFRSAMPVKAKVKKI